MSKINRVSVKIYKNEGLFYNKIIFPIFINILDCFGTVFWLSMISTILKLESKFFFIFEKPAESNFEKKKFKSKKLKFLKKKNVEFF